MRAFTQEQRTYQDIHPGFTPFNTPTNTSSTCSEVPSFDSDYFIIILLLAIFLSDEENPLKFF